MKRGEIFWAKLEPRSESEQKGRRPVVVVSHDGFNRTPTWSTVIVVPLSTSKKQRKRWLTAVPLPKGVAGLSRASVALCHQVTTLDRTKLVQRIGALPAELIRDIEEGLNAALDLG